MEYSLTWTYLTILYLYFENFQKPIPEAFYTKVK